MNVSLFSVLTCFLEAGIGGDDLPRNLMITMKLEPHLMMGLGSPLLPAIITTFNQGFTVFGSRRCGDVEINFNFTTYRKFLAYSSMF